MKRYWRDFSTALHGVTAVALAASLITAPVAQAWAQDNNFGHDEPARGESARGGQTATLIKHIIIIIGENRTFDHVFATYTPRNGEKIQNLLSEGIVKADGTPGPKFKLAAQNSAVVQGSYTISPSNKTPYTKLPPVLTDGASSAASNTNPPPFASVAAVAATEAQIKDGLPTEDFALLTTGATGLPSDSIDTRIANAAAPANGPYQITGPKLPYDSYTSSPVHRFYQMWQQADCSVAHATAASPSGCLNDLFPFVEVSAGTGGNGTPQAANFTDQTTGEGSTSMGFYNMATGDAPYFKQLSDQFTISDNFHQSVMGGTGANHVALGTGLAVYYTDGSGNIATPPANQIENPTPQPGTNNWWTQDGYSGGSYSKCSDETQPGVKQVTAYLASLPYKPAAHCKPGAYYLLNNYNPGYYGDGTINTSTFTIPPSSVPTIANQLNERNISWAYYGAGWDAYVANPSSTAGSIYCNICNPFLYNT
jgi:phospholipase C